MFGSKRHKALIVRMDLTNSYLDSLNMHLKYLCGDLRAGRFGVEDAWNNLASKCDRVEKTIRDISESLARFESNLESVASKARDLERMRQSAPPLEGE